MKKIDIKLNAAMTSCLRSWSFVQESFAENFKQLEDSGDLVKDGPYPVIWDTKQKFVLKVPTASGMNIVYKSYNKLRKAYKYMFRLSPCGTEALNYQIIKELGIDVPELLAVGDVRKNLVLKTAFIVTEFAEGFRDGRDFMPGGILAHDAALRNEFIFRNMQLLARLHNSKILHRGFTPANLLYKLNDVPENQAEKLLLKWIDVASCRKVSRYTLKKKLPAEMVQFFRFFDFKDDKIAEYVNCYTQALDNPLYTPEKLCRLIGESLQKRLTRKA